MDSADQKKVVKRSSRRPSGHATLEDIAQHCGVSISTVSRVINNRTDQFPLAAHTIAKVHAAAELLGYRPNRLARAIAYGKTNLIGLSIPHHQDGHNRTEIKEDTYFTAQIFGLLAGGILDNPDILNYDLVIHDRRKFNRTNNRYDAFQTDLLDGIIYCNPTEDSIAFIRSLPKNFPVILLGHCPELADRVISVDIDNVAAALMCVEHLHAIRRKNILILSPANLSQYLCIKDRLCGYIQGIEKYNLTKMPGDKIVQLNQDSATVKEWFKRNKGEISKFDSILAPTDEMAMFCIDAILGIGLSIPEDLAVIGFSDSIQAQLNMPSLTSIKMPFHEMGYRAAGLLADVLNQKSPFTPKHYTLDTELILRQSSTSLV